MSQNEPKMSQNEPKMSQNEPSMSQKSKTIKNELLGTTINSKMEKVKDIWCEYCGKTFNTKPNMRRHQKYRCKDNPEFLEQLILEKNQKIKKLEEEKNEWRKEKTELYGKMDVLLTKVGNTNIQNNITLNSYGNENLSHLTDALKTTLLKIPYGAIPKMIEAIHFNDEIPENKNIVLKKKENLIKVYQGDKWIYKNKEDTLKDLVDSKYMIMDEHYEENKKKEKLETNVEMQYIEFRKFYDNGDKEIVEKLKRECEMVLLNNR